MPSFILRGVDIVVGSHFVRSGFGRHWPYNCLLITTCVKEVVSFAPVADSIVVARVTFLWSQRGACCPDYVKRGVCGGLGLTSTRFLGNTWRKG